ncbi:MAG: M23 family metallopeptidase [Caldilineae bacterium]|nr:M23 family metallopeptidase [Chloroflexota bacterium]MCB9175921.1 M23 family metallopeptidase [Caldilineae bacterium]
MLGRATRHDSHRSAIRREVAGSGTGRRISTVWLLVGLLVSLLILSQLGRGGRLEARARAVPAPLGSPAEPLAPGLADFVRGPEQLLQDAELVFGAGAGRFDTAAFLAGRPELLPGPPAATAAAIDGVARRHAIDPRLLLSLLSLDPAGEGVDTADRAARIAVWLADGYYGLKLRGEADLIFADGSRQRGPVEGGAAHFAVARYLARQGTAVEQPARQARFAERYAELFGAAPRLEAPVPDGLRQPPLLLPWAEGQRWHYTGGPHGAWGVASAWGAVDFAPPSLVGCRAAPEWTLAAAPGRVTWSDTGLVLVDLDGDGNEGTGWVLAYLHMASEGRVAVGRWLEAGEPLGHPSCEGGVADGAHLHFARRYNGEWLPAAGGPVPMELSGWRFSSLGGEYDGSMQHPEQGERMAVTSRRGGASDLVSDNGPARREALASAWAALSAGAPARLEDADSGLSRAPEPMTEAARPAAPATAAAAMSAAGGATGAATIAVRIALEGRDDASTPVVLGLVGAAAPPLVLMARTNAAGETGAIALPDEARGIYDLTLRAPGFAPAFVLGVTIGEPGLEIDLSAGGRLRLAAGELNGDDVIDGRDLGAWLTHWRAGRPLADLDGDGWAGPGDLWRAMNAAAGR